MASEQIQKLTSVLYQEGIEKGEKKAEEIIEGARQKADEIIEKAKKEAEAILKDTEEKSRAFKTHVETETRIAAKEIIHDFHHRVMDMILTKVIDEKAEQAFSNTGNIETWILKIIENWKVDSKDQPAIDIFLSENDRKDFDKWFEQESYKALKNSVNIDFTDAINGGFRIIPQKGSFQIDITPESFEELFRHYLKSRTRKLLFGE
jgi:V/A-type H+-transporting ATPase subunit E